MASNTNSVVLNENDIPGASLNGRNATQLKNDELRYWLKCRGDSGKGLKTKAELVKRVEDFIRSGKDKNIIDPDPNKLFTRRKEERSKKSVNPDSESAVAKVPVKYPENNWGISLEKMPMFTKAEMDNHIQKSGKNIGNKDNTSIPTSLRRAQTFLHDEYLHNIETNHDQRFFYFKANCCHSYKKNDPPHILKLALCIIQGEVLHSSCSCVAGNVGYCNHVLALMLKLCKYVLFECKTTKDLCKDKDESESLACTSELQKWHRKGGGSHITPQPISSVTVNKLKTENESKRTSNGVKSLLYEARVNPLYNQQSIDDFKKTLNNLNANMGLSQMADELEPVLFVDTKFGKCPVGSIASYQQTYTESNFTAHADLTMTAKRSHPVPVNSYPPFPLLEEDHMTTPRDLSPEEQLLISKLTLDEGKINEIEHKTRQQADCEQWKEERMYRFTASNFHLISHRVRNHDSLAHNLMHPKELNNQSIKHGRNFEPVALMEYSKYMKAIGNPVTVLPSGFVVSKSHPVLGASPDARVIDQRCEDCFGLAEVKCPYKMANVTPVDAASDQNFCMEKTSSTTCELKKNHMYYAQVQGQMGVTRAKWCDFIVYTKKGLYIQRVPFDRDYWNSLRDKLTTYYFTHFIKYAIDDLSIQDTNDVN